MERKIINILMWIPVIGLITGIYQITRILCDDCWFNRISFGVGILNSMWLGGSSVLLIHLIGCI